MSEMTRSPLLRYGMVLGTVSLALLFTYLIKPLRDETQTVLFFAAVVLSAWFGGLGPGLLAAVISIVGIDFFFLDPVYELKVDVANLVRVTMFMLVAVLISSLASSQKRKEQALSESEERFRAMADSAPVMIWVTGRDRLCTYVNRGWLDFTGRAMEQETGAGWSESIHPDDREHYLNTYSRAFASRRSFELECRLRRHDGEYRWIIGKGVPRRMPNGSFGGYIGSCIDITERKQAESERERLLENETAARREAEQAQRLISEILAREQAAREEAEAASRTKDEFLATISHELRTPLNAVLGWAGMLRAGKLDEATSAKALEIIERNARSQAQLIEDILDVSRIITGRLKLNVSRVDLSSVIRQAVDVVRPAADAKEISIELTLDMKAGAISADPNRLQQIIWNLLANAVKFTPRGGRVRVRLEVADPNAEITVSDTGEGISPEFLPYVFDRFRQADSSFSRKHGGLGLGLSIVRYLVEMHGGTVQAISEGNGKGATFKVTLPLIAEAGRVNRVAPDAKGRPDSGGPLPEPPHSLEGTSVLVVEDNPDGRELLVTTLKMYGARVRAASSVAEALEAIRQSKPDLLLSDIEMPGEDGYHLIRKIRSLEGELGGVIAVALTAHTRAEDRARALAEGFHSHIAKPIDPKVLIDLISGLTRKSRAV